jgi:hypothetical protein
MYKKGPAQKRIMMLYGICVLILLVNIPIANMYHEILGLAATLIAAFFSAFQFSALMMTWRRSPAEVYREKPYGYRQYEWAGQLNPAANGVVSGIIMMIAVLVATPVTDWEWLGVPVINPLIILWTVNGILAIYTGLYARKNGYGSVVKVKSPEYRKPGEYE